MARRSIPILLLLLLVPAGGCVGKESTEKQIDPAYIKRNLLAAPPAAIQHRVDANLGGSVVYLGCDVDRPQLAPGGTATVVHYWKVLSPPGPEWGVFGHLVGSGKKWMNLDRSDMRVGYPPRDWKAGDIIRDEQTFTLDKDWKSPYAQFTVGLYRRGSNGPEDRMPIEKGPVDKQGRVLACRFSIDGLTARRPPPDYMIRRAKGAIQIDGKADEADWQAASPSPPFTGAEGGPEVKGQARARLLWDDAHLYAFVEVEDGDVASQYTTRDATLWKQDTVEIFIDADRNRRGYVELQVNPRNAHFDAWFPRTRAQQNHPEWNSQMKSAVAVRGTLDDRNDDDQGWNVEIAIPIADVKGMDAAMQVTTPPVPGDRWRLNVIRIEKPEEGPLGASSWSAIPIADFHALARMITVVFADEEGKSPDPLQPAAAKPSPPPSETSHPAQPATKEKPKPAAKSDAKQGDPPRGGTEAAAPKPDAKRGN